MININVFCFIFIPGVQKYYSNEVKFTIFNGLIITRPSVIMSENKKESTHPPLKRYR